MLNVDLTKLVTVLQSIKVRDPDQDGLTWLSIDHPEGRASFNLGKGPIAIKAIQTCDKDRRELLKQLGI